MSNHSGSYMLNEVLRLVLKYKLDEAMGKEKTAEFVKSVMKIGDRQDCNSGEILEDIGAKLGVCYYCEKAADIHKNDVCKKCFDELYDEEDE